MAYTASGISTLGIELGYGAYSNNAVLPSALTALGRINAIGGVQLSTENIDSSAIVDKITQYIQGRQDTGGDWTITINLTDETLAEWKAIAGEKVWFEIYHPSMTYALWLVATVPEKLGVPDIAQNELLTYEISLTLNYYYGWSNANVIALDSEGTNTVYTISLDQAAITLTSVGDTETLVATVSPADTRVTWSSSDESVAMVSQTGTVIEVSAGTATITAVAGNASATCAVTASV